MNARQPLMDEPEESTAHTIRDFLISRRDKVTPAMLGLPSGRRRKVPGLRREEVAVLAGVSLDYYIQIERGNLRGVSPEVLNAIAVALKLDEAERAYLDNLAESAEARSAPQLPPPTSSFAQIPEPLQSIIDSIGGVAATVMTPRLDLVATNSLARQLMPEVFTDATGNALSEPNHARFVFTDPRSRDFYVDWESMAKDVAGMLRTAEARSSQRRAVSQLVRELHTSSTEFPAVWADHHVVLNRRGRKSIRHSRLGTFDIHFEVLGVASPDTGAQEHELLLYSAVSGDRTSTEKMDELAAQALTDPLGRPREN